MSFLGQYWDKLPFYGELGCPKEAVGVGFYRPWVSDQGNILRILKSLELLTATKVVETGTYEGFTTLEMAKIVDVSSKQRGIIGEVYTFDTLGPVSCYSDGKTESINWKSEPQWEGWENLINVRNLRLSSSFSNCKIEFIVGLTQTTLPENTHKLKDFDFWYQDSVHSLELIIGEWNCMYPISKVGSIVVFDDIVETHPLRDWFPKNTPGWIYKIAENKTRSQLWAERIN